MSLSDGPSVVPRNKVCVLIPKLNIVFKGVPEGLQSIKRGKAKNDEDYPVPSESKASNKAKQNTHKRKARHNEEDEFPEFRQVAINELTEAFSTGLGLYKSTLSKEIIDIPIWDASKVENFAREVDRIIAHEFFGDLSVLSKEARLGYSRKLRSIKVFLGSCANPELFKQIVLGHITVTGLVQTSNKHLLSPEEKIRYDHFRVSTPTTFKSATTSNVRIIKVTPSQSNENL